MAVIATFGETEYIEPNIIHLPIMFNDNICSLDCSDFSITGIDELESLSVSGEGDEYSLHLSPAIGLIGIMEVEITGSVYVSSNDPEPVFSPVRSIRYDSREIYVTGKQLPPSILPGLQTAYFDLNREVVGISPQSILISGVDVGPPKIYAADIPDIEIPAGLRPLPIQYLEYNNSDIPRRYFRLDFEFPEPPPIGTLNIDIKDGQVLGYVDPYVPPEIPDINLTFTTGLVFDQSYEISASEDTTISVSGLPAGIMFQDTGDNILRIYGTPTTAGSGVAIISVNMEEVTSEVNWIVASAQRRRTDDKRGSGPRQGTPVLSMNDATIFFGQDFDVSGTISGNPTNVYVEGLLRNWTYTYASGSLHVLGDADDVKRIESGVWKVIMEYGNNQEIEDTVNWNVAESIPSITNPGRQTFYTNLPLNYEIKISNLPSVTVKGLLAKMYYAGSDTGVNLKGNPDREVSLSEGRRIEINASNSGGTDTDSFRFDIRELELLYLDHQFREVLPVTINGDDGDAAVFGDRVRLNIVSPQGLAYLGNNKIAVEAGTNIFVLDIDVSEGQFATQDKQLILPSAWGTILGMSYLGNDKVLVLEDSPDTIGIFDISASDGSSITPDKALTLPTGWTFPSAITSLGNDRVAVSERSGTDRVGIFDISVADGQEAVLIKSLDFPTSWTSPDGIASASGALIVADQNARSIGVFDISGADGTSAKLYKSLRITSLRDNPSGLAIR